MQDENLTLQEKEERWLKAVHRKILIMYKQMKNITTK